MDHLIHPDLFRPLSQVTLIVIFIIAMAVIVKGAEWLVEGVANIAYRLGISKIVVAATILSLGTTSPETAVSVAAAWADKPGLALGNAVGSVIADTALIFALGCILVILPADKFILHRQGWLQIGSAVLLAVICYSTYAIAGPGATIGRPVGILFLILLVGYIYLSIRWGRAHPQSEPFMPPEESGAPVLPRPLWFLIAMAIVGLVLVIFSSHILINSISVLAEDHWGVPQVVVAATIVALGTSLPELVIGLTSVWKGHKEVLVGNVIGADILNILWVTGAAAVAAPLPLFDHDAPQPGIFLFLHLPVMLGVLILFRIFMQRAIGRGSFRRWYGLPLIAIYLGYVIVQFAITVDR